MTSAANMVVLGGDDETHIGFLSVVSEIRVSSDNLEQGQDLISLTLGRVHLEDGSDLKLLGAHHSQVKTALDVIPHGLIGAIVIVSPMNIGAPEAARDAIAELNARRLPLVLLSVGGGSIPGSEPTLSIETIDQASAREAIITLIDQALNAEDAGTTDARS